MKRFALSVAVGTFSLFTMSCSKNDAGDGEVSVGGSNSGGATGVGGNNGTGSATTNTGAATTAIAATTGGALGSGGAAATTTRQDAAVSGGTSSGGASMVKGGANGIGGAKGGAAGTFGSGIGGKPSVGGATATSGALGGASAKGGAAGIAGSGSGSKSSVGGATATSRALGGASARGGAAGIAGSGNGGNASVGGATGTAGAPASGPSTGCGKATSLTSARASIDAAGKTREYILALPKNYDPNHPYKLVFAWHPWTGSAQQIASGGYYGLQREANNEAIFVAAEGLDFTQGGQSGLGWGNANGEDVTFYHAMLDRLRSELCIDENRIFSVGFSFGAMFSFTLGCTAESMLRAIVPMAGNTFTSGGCASGTRSVAVMALIGLQDSLLDGHRQAVTTYTKRDGCTATTSAMNPSWCDGLASDPACSCVNYQGCKDGYPVTSCEYTAGHQQAPNPGPIWDFLAQF